MRTYLDCIPCFFKQALEAARIAEVEPEAQREILNALAQTLPDFPLEASPPEMGRIIHRIVKRITKVEDPYREIKDRSNCFALEYYDRLIDKVEQSGDRLLTAVELAIAGNIIDYGVKNILDVDAELRRILEHEHMSVKHKDGKTFQIEEFRITLDKAKTVVYLADNTGETVFDRVLIEEIKRKDPEKEIFYIVKDKPIINDALIKDAQDCGIDKVAVIMSSGSDAPGTILSFCSDEFLNRFRAADLVISKGQGNFEGLSGTPVDSLYYLLLAKCPVIANDIGCDVGDVILLKAKTH